MILLYLMTTTIGMLFFFMMHPITMGIMIIIYVIPISILIGINSQNFWYSYIIILIYLGGLLILFLYITSLASNEKIFLKTSWHLKFTIIIMTLLLVSLTLLVFSDQIQNTDSLQESLQIFSNENNSYTSFFSKPVGKITIFLASYLLLCLISVVKICHLIEGPIRALN
uniref:NADH-ubiquinone oxidoreductase chain 6 n=1 Tax=Epiperipatus biolleyi TaxID=172520 RepID=F8RJ82_EPIBI|nr:NADH dehydrogenase subunit 6 [Epiperipatus biolleyi]